MAAQVCLLRRVRSYRVYFPFKFSTKFYFVLFIFILYLFYLYLKFYFVLHKIWACFMAYPILVVECTHIR